MASKYDSSLPKLYVDKAHKELHEKPDHVAAHIKSLKRCIEGMPHLTCPEDDAFYMAFLRQAKYQHSRAQARIDNFVTLRCSPTQATSAWFDRSGLTPTIIEQYLSFGIHVPVGFLADGTFLFLLRLGQWDESVITSDVLFTFATLQLDRLMEDPRIQIAGLHLLFDMTGLSSSQLAKVNPRRNVKEISKLFQEGYPMRIKSFIYYNEPTIVDFMMKLVMNWMKPKLRDRIFRVKDDIGKACKKVPGLRAALPAEYGGDNLSVSQILAQFGPEFKKYIKGHHLWDGIAVDESKRPESAKNYMSEYKDYPEHAMGTSGTYIQLPQKD